MTILTLEIIAYPKGDIVDLKDLSAEGAQELIEEAKDMVSRLKRIASRREA